MVDLAAARQGIGAFVASREPVVSYLGVLSGVQLGVRPVSAPGYEAIPFDPLAKQPAAAARIAQALDNGRALSGCLSTLHGWATGGMAWAVTPILPQLETVRDLLAAMPEDAPATPEQARQLNEALATANVYADLIGHAARQVRDGVIGFLGRLADDHTALTGGQTALAAVVRQLESDTVAAAQPYVLSQFGRGIGEAILAEGRLLREQLLRFDRFLAGALAGHAQIGSGISALGSAVETIAAKYASAQRAVSRAGNAALPQVVRKLEPAKAIVFWRDFLKFIETSGL